MSRRRRLARWSGLVSGLSGLVFVPLALNPKDADTEPVFKKPRIYVTTFARSAHSIFVVSLPPALLVPLAGVSADRVSVSARRQALAAVLSHSLSQSVTDCIGRCFIAQAMMTTNQVVVAVPDLVISHPDLHSPNRHLLYSSRTARGLTIYFLYFLFLFIYIYSYFIMFIN